MKKILVTNLKPGMILAEDVLTPRGQLLFEAGTPLDKRVISRLRFYNLTFVSVDDVISGILQETPKEDGTLAATEILPPPEQTPAPEEPKMPVPKKTAPATESAPQIAAMPTSSTIEDTTDGTVLPQEIEDSLRLLSFQSTYADCAVALQGIFHKITSTSEPVTQLDLEAIALSLYNPTLPSAEFFTLFHALRAPADPIYTHSLNVSMLCRYLGRWLHFSEEDQLCLSVCGLLHDIGKLLIPDDILQKPGQLTDEERAIVRRHPLMGFQLIKDLKLDARVKKSVLMHHERSNASGYPYGRGPTEVHPFAQAVAIADVYDATTSKRSYRSAFCPFTVISAFEQGGVERYNTQFLIPFLENIAYTYQKHRVMLNDGRPGEIVMFNRSQFSRPILRLVDGTFLDLSGTEDIWIQSVM